MALIVFVVYLLIRIVRHFTAKRCAGCNNIMSLSEQEKVFKGCGDLYPAISRKVFICSECATEYHELYYDINKSASRYSINTSKNKVCKMTEQEFIKLLNELNESVNNHNIQAGFTRTKQLKP